MANYTIELRDVVSQHNIFNFKYPFYDENERKKFEDDFIRHFYFREIGFETIERFKWNLKDKFYTVFPYYNELFKASKIEYSVLDNYNLKETNTTTRENSERGGTVSSTVGQLFGDQEAKTDEGTVKENNETITAKGASERTTETGATETEKGNNISNRSTSEEHASAGNQSTNKTAENTATHTATTGATGMESTDKNTARVGTDEKEEIKKFLDTPQGAVDLTNSNYLTTLNHDTLSSSTGETSKDQGETKTASVTETEDETTSSNTENAETKTGEVRTADSEENVNNSNETERHSAGTSTESNETSEEGTRNSRESQAITNDTSIHEEKKTTQDINTRSETSGNQKEVHEMVRTGNIGVDSDADMIQKHIKLQQILKKIELMFFDECEDLFMGVY